MERNQNAYQAQEGQKKFNQGKRQQTPKVNTRKNTELQTLSFGINDKSYNNQIGNSSRKGGFAL